VRRGDIEPKLLDQPSEAGRLTLGQVEDESSQRRGVDDRVLEGALQPAADEPGVERVVAVLDENRALGEAEESSARVPELRRANEHRAVDVVSFPRIRIDGRAAVDQRVEEGQRARECEPLRADLEDEEWGVAGRLDIQRDQLRILELRPVGDLGRVDGDLFPRDGLGRSSGFQKQFPRRRAHRASARARRAHAISSPLKARSKRIAAQ
jgi:hypothetical protein